MRLLCVIVFGFFVLQVHAQSIRFGATTAYNATFVLDEGLNKDPRYNSTYTYNLAPIGFAFGVDVSRKFGLQLESILSNQGQIYQLVNTAKQVAGERKIDLQYLQLPLMMKFMGGGSGAVRGNFNFGPQLSILTKAVEIVQANAGNNFTIPAGLTIADIQQDFPNATLNPDGTYRVPANTAKDVLTKEANDFKNTEFALAAAFGLDFDLSRHLMLSTQVRANYSLTDMRNGDVINAIKNGNASDLFGSRANVLVGVQLGLHYSLGVLRSRKD
jgi:opacity protein-like surface antigen